MVLDVRNVVGRLAHWQWPWAAASSVAALCGECRWIRRWATSIIIIGVLYRLQHCLKTELKKTMIL